MAIHQLHYPTHMTRAIPNRRPSTAKISMRWTVSVREASIAEIGTSGDPGPWITAKATNRNSPEGPRQLAPVLVPCPDLLFRDPALYHINEESCFNHEAILYILYNFYYYIIYIPSLSCFFCL